MSNKLIKNVFVDLVEKYKKFVVINSETLGHLESAARILSYVAPGAYKWNNRYTIQWFGMQIFGPRGCLVALSWNSLFNMLSGAPNLQNPHYRSINTGRSSSRNLFWGLAKLWAH